VEGGEWARTMVVMFVVDLADEAAVGRVYRALACSVRVVCVCVRGEGRRGFGRGLWCM
jgi:hypothetical protein